MLIYAALLTEIFKLINNLLEGKPLEQRQAEALIWFNLTWPLFKNSVSKDQAEAIENVIKNIKIGA